MKRKVRIRRRGYVYVNRKLRKRIRVPPHKVTYYKNYGTFKFIAPAEQFKRTGRVEPEFARFGTDKLKLQSERINMEKVLAKQLTIEEIANVIGKPAEEQAIKEAIEKSPEKLKKLSKKDLSEISRVQQPTKPKEVTKLPKKEEKEKTMEQLIQERKSREGQKKRERKIDVIFDQFGHLTEDEKQLANKKLIALSKKDPRGRSVNLMEMVKGAIRLAREELQEGKQTVIKGVKTFEDSDYIKALREAGFPQQQAEFMLFSLPPKDIEGRTPQEVVKIAEKFSESGATRSEEGFASEEKVKTISADRATGLLNKLIEFRPDLKKHNRIALLTKLRRDIRDSTELLKQKGISGDEELLGELQDFFSYDKPLKESLEGEKTFSSFRITQSRKFKTRK